MKNKRFERTQLFPSIEINTIITLHYFKYSKNFVGREEFHDFWELVYVDSGEIEVQADDKRSLLPQGHLIFHKPLERHNIFTHNCFASTFILTFDCSSPTIKLFENRILKVDSKEKNLISNIISEGIDLFEEPLDIMDQVKMKKRKKVNFGSEQIIKTSIESLFISFIRNINISPEKSHPIVYPKPDLYLKEGESTSEIFIETVKYLENNVTKKIFLDEISKSVGVSKSKLEKIFKKHTDGGVIQYFIRLKVEEAKKLLSVPHKSVSKVAFELNFNSIHYFSRSFKRYTNISPSTFKKIVYSEMLL